MRFRTVVAFVATLAWLGGSVRGAGEPSFGDPKKALPACRVGVVEGELNAGKSFERPIGSALKLWFQPIASGWILRVVPVAGPVVDPDYAELATPPYQSVTPLSLSTDFAFRAQDAVGWNPRRFRFAAFEAEFNRLSEVYRRYEGAGTAPPPALEGELAEEVSKAPEGKLTIVDARLVPGMADQWKMAAAVSSRFETTAHTLALPADGKQSPLGELLWIRFRVELALPTGFVAARDLKILPHACGSL